MRSQERVQKSRKRSSWGRFKNLCDLLFNFTGKKWQLQSDSSQNVCITFCPTYGHSEKAIIFFQINSAPVQMANRAWPNPSKLFRNNFYHSALALSTHTHNSIACVPFAAPWPWTTNLFHHVLPIKLRNLTLAELVVNFLQTGLWETEPAFPDGI